MLRDAAADSGDAGFDAAQETRANQRAAFLEDAQGLEMTLLVGAVACALRLMEQGRRQVVERLFGGRREPVAGDLEQTFAQCPDARRQVAATGKRRRAPGAGLGWCIHLIPRDLRCSGSGAPSARAPHSCMRGAPGNRGARTIAMIRQRPGCQTICTNTDRPATL